VWVCVVCVCVCVCVCGVCVCEDTLPHSVCWRVLHECHRKKRAWILESVPRASEPARDMWPPLGQTNILANSFEGACPNCGWFSEKFFRAWKTWVFQHCISLYFTDGLRPAARATTGQARPLRPVVASVESNDVTAGSELLTEPHYCVRTACFGTGTASVPWYDLIPSGNKERQFCYYRYIKCCPTTGFLNHNYRCPM